MDSRLLSRATGVRCCIPYKHGAYMREEIQSGEGDGGGNHLLGR